MNKDLAFSFGLFLIISIGSLVSRLFHLYDLFWFTDIVLHTMSGMAFGFLWLFIAREEQSRFALALGTISFAVLGSLLWEYGELGAWKFLPFYAPFYSPNFFDTIGDVTCGMVGGFFTSLTVFKR